MTSKLEQPMNAEILDAIKGVKNDVKDITRAEILDAIEGVKSEVDIVDSIFELVDKMWQRDVTNFRNRESMNL